MPPKKQTTLQGWGIKSVADLQLKVEQSKALAGQVTEVTRAPEFQDGVHPIQRDVQGVADVRAEIEEVSARIKEKRKELTALLGTFEEDTSLDIEAALFRLPEPMVTELMNACFRSTLFERLQGVENPADALAAAQRYQAETRERHERDKKALEGQIKELKSKNAGIEASLSTLQNENSSLKENLGSTSRQYIRLENDFEMLSMALEEACGEIGDLEEEATRLRPFETSYGRAEAERHRLSQEVERLQGQVDTYNERCAVYDKRIANLETECCSKKAKLSKELVHTITERDEVSAALANMITTRNTLETRVSELETSYQAIVQERGQLRAVCSRLKSRVLKGYLSEKRHFAGERAPLDNRARALEVERNQLAEQNAERNAEFLAALDVFSQLANDVEDGYEEYIEALDEDHDRLLAEYDRVLDRCQNLELAREAAADINHKWSEKIAELNETANNLTESENDLLVLCAEQQSINRNLQQRLENQTASSGAREREQVERIRDLERQLVEQTQGFTEASDKVNQQQRIIQTLREESEEDDLTIQALNHQIDELEEQNGNYEREILSRSFALANHVPGVSIQMWEPLLVRLMEGEDEDGHTDLGAIERESWPLFGLSDPTRGADGLSEPDSSQPEDPAAWEILNSRPNIAAHQLFAAFKTGRWQNPETLRLASHLANSVANGERLNVEVAQIALHNVVSVLVKTRDSVSLSADGYMVILGLFQAFAVLDERFPGSFYGLIVRSKIDYLRGLPEGGMTGMLRGMLGQELTTENLPGKTISIGTTTLVAGMSEEFFLMVDTGSGVTQVVLKRHCTWQPGEGHGLVFINDPDGQEIMDFDLADQDEFDWWVSHIGIL